MWPVSINLDGDAFWNQREIDPDLSTVDGAMFRLYLRPSEICAGTPAITPSV
jgi:hypothetical protein